MTEILALRRRFARLMACLLWLHVPLILVVSLRLHHPVAAPLIFAVMLALAYQVTWWRAGIGPATRYVSAVALMGEPALLVYLLMGNPWQVDMHMYFFAGLALLIAWCDWRVIALASFAILLHHLALDLVLPYAVFPNGADLSRVAFHVAIVALEGTVLIWLSNTLLTAFRRVERLGAEIQRHNDTLEETVAARTKEAQAASIASIAILVPGEYEPRNPYADERHPRLQPSRFADGTEREAARLRAEDQDGEWKSSAGLINDILDFSKIEAGKLVLEATPFSLRTTLETVRSLVALPALEKGIDLQFTVDEDTPDGLIGDPLRLNQVIINLVSNAIKFTAEGEVALSVQSRQDDDLAGVTIVLSVCDSGIGMTEAQLRQLFTAFTQADASVTRRFGGTGLGLTISRELVELMGGELSVTSEMGVGSVFTFTARFSLSGEERLPLRTLPEHLGRLRVLVADDNAASRDILQETFLTLGIRVDLAASGAEAISLLRAAANGDHPYDLVLLDWRMPGMDGMETARSLREDANIRKVPAVIMVSAYSREEATSEAAAAGVAAFLVKPVNPEILLDTLASLFGKEGGETLAARETTQIPRVPQELRGSVLLLAEDNEINREVAIEILTDAGLVVETAENGRIACDMIRANPMRYDVVLMDVQMPEMDGIEATQIIRTTHSAADLPIIAMTAHAYEKERQKCLDAGMNDHSAKPIEPALLVETLTRWLKPRKLDAAVVAVPAADQPAGDLPDSLPPFDIDGALARLNGRRKLLRKLIVDFGRKFGDAVPDVRRQLAWGQWDDARRQAHTLKGVAGALELRKVTEASRQLEDALVERAVADLPLLLAVITLVIKIVLESRRLAVNAARPH